MFKESDLIVAFLRLSLLNDKSCGGNAMIILKITKWFIAIGLFFSLLIAISSFYINSQFQAVDSSDKKKYSIDILKGSSVDKIAEILENNNLIKNKYTFKTYVKYSGYATDLKAGKYNLAKNMELKEIVQELVTGSTYIDSIIFTIPEGHNVKQIAEKLAEEGIVDQDEFLRLVEEGDFDNNFIDQIPEDNNLEYKLEGHLFPKTYEIKKGASEREIIEIMLNQFSKEWSPEWDKIIKEKEITMHQLITLASLVEREVIVEKERAIVAGVLFNRLNNNWPLQIDATIQYILGKQKERLLYEDLEVKHPYNTYLNIGLPPGPIANPGIASIEAVLNPEEHNYFFYVTKKDNSGEHFFAKTYSEHLINKDKSSKN